MNNTINEGQSIESIKLDIVDLTEATKLACAILFKSIMYQYIWLFRGLFACWVLAMIAHIYFFAKNAKILNGLINDYTLNLVYNSQFLVALIFIAFIIYAMIKQKMILHYFYKLSYLNEPSQFYADKNIFKFIHCNGDMVYNMSWQIVSEIIEIPQGHIVLKLNNRSIFAIPSEAFTDKQHKKQILQQLQDWQSRYQS